MFKVIIVKAWLSFTRNSANSGDILGVFLAALLLASVTVEVCGGLLVTTVSRSFSFKIRTSLNLHEL